MERTFVLKRSLKGARVCGVVGRTKTASDWNAAPEQSARTHVAVVVSHASHVLRKDRATEANIRSNLGQYLIGHRLSLSVILYREFARDITIRGMEKRFRVI